MGSSKQTQQTNQQKDPWAPAIPYLTSMLGDAYKQYQTPIKQWGGPLQAPLDPSMQQGFDWIKNIATGPNKPLGFLDQSIFGIGQIGDRIGQLDTTGKTASEQYLPAWLRGARGPTAADKLGTRTAASQLGPTAASSYLTSMASGQDAGKNPYLTAMLDANADRIANRTSSMAAGMGRYGSGAHTDVMARSIAEANNPILAQAYESDQNRRLAASGQIDQAALARAGLIDSSALARAGLQDQSRLGANAQWLSGVGQLDQSRNARDALGLQRDQLGLQANQMIGQFAPMYNQLQYDPANRMVQMGGFMTDRAQQLLEMQKQQFQQQQMEPWQRLQMLSGMIFPAAGLGGTQTGTTTTTQQKNPWETAIGLGMMGMGAFTGNPMMMMGGMGGLGGGMPMMGNPMRMGSLY